MNIIYPSEIPIESGIYKFTNLINKKIYIGSAKNLRKRFIQHLSNLKNNKHHSKHFQNAWNKYGKDNFIYEIIEFVHDFDNLLIREQYYLDTLLFAQEYINKINIKFLELGYNINPSAKNRLGCIQSEQSIYKSVLNNDRVLPVIWIDFNGEEKGRFISTGEASKVSGISRNSIWYCCTNKSEYTKVGFFIFEKDFNDLKEYFNSLKNSPFVPQVWNKSLKFRPDKEKSLILFDRYGRYIDTFSYQTDVAKFINCSTSNLSNSKNKKICKNYLLFDTSFDYIPIINKIREKYEFLFSFDKIPDKIMVYDNFDNFITGFDSVDSAAEIMNMKSNSIYGVLCGKRKQNDGFKFKYYDDIV